MEVCGTHTHALFAHGIRSMIPTNLRLISGPGCPVCVTSQEDIEKMISLTKIPDVTVCTFGDMMRVPGVTGSLSESKTEGEDIRVMYSPFDIIGWAQKESDRQFVLIGIGFETTIPSFAATLQTAKQMELKNFSILSLHKSVVQALDPLVNIPGISVDGFMLPGHVITITGVRPFRVLENRYRIASVVTGFEALDMLASIESLTRMINNDKPMVLNQYNRVVKEDGNIRAQQIMDDVFEPCDSVWRGMGLIPNSGCKLRNEYAEYDAEKRFDISVEPTPEPPGCICGKVITGSAEPTECPLFAKSCTPANPIGPCMVSGEGTCSAYYKYKRN
jgi:hydrogenase expression/formation protein HypD